MKLVFLFTILLYDSIVYSLVGGFMLWFWLVGRLWNGLVYNFIDGMYLVLFSRMKIW